MLGNVVKSKRGIPKHRHRDGLQMYKASDFKYRLSVLTPYILNVIFVPSTCLRCKKNRNKKAGLCKDFAKVELKVERVELDQLNVETLRRTA